MDAMIIRCSKEELSFFSPYHQEDMGKEKYCSTQVIPAPKSGCTRGEGDATTVYLWGNLAGVTAYVAANPLVCWNPPSFGRYKVNWDVTLDSRTKQIGIWIVVRDHSGFVIAAQGKRTTGLPELVHVEAMGALAVAELIQDLGLPDVVMEGDSLQVFKPYQI